MPGVSALGAPAHSCVAVLRMLNGVSVSRGEVSDYYLRKNIAYKLQCCHN